MLPTSRTIRSWIQSLCWQAPGNWCETEIKTQQRVLTRECWKQQRDDVCDSSGGRLDYHFLQISDCRYVWEVENLRHKLRLSSGTLDAKTNVFYLGITYVDNGEVISSSRNRIPRTLCCFKKYQLRGAQDVVRLYAETDRGTIIRDSECM